MRCAEDIIASLFQCRRPITYDLALATVVDDDEPGIIEHITAGVVAGIDRNGQLTLEVHRWLMQLPDTQVRVSAVLHEAERRADVIVIYAIHLTAFRLVRPTAPLPSFATVEMQMVG